MPFAKLRWPWSFPQNSQCARQWAETWVELTCILKTPKLQTAQATSAPGWCRSAVGLGTQQEQGPDGREVGRAGQLFCWYILGWKFFWFCSRVNLVTGNIKTLPMARVPTSLLKVLTQCLENSSEFSGTMSERRARPKPWWKPLIASPQAYLDWRSAFKRIPGTRMPYSQTARMQGSSFSCLPHFFSFLTVTCSSQPLASPKVLDSALLHH